MAFSHLLHKIIMQIRCTLYCTCILSCENLLFCGISINNKLILLHYIVYVVPLIIVIIRPFWWDLLNEENENEENLWKCCKYPSEEEKFYNPVRKNFIPKLYPIKEIFISVRKTFHPKFKKKNKIFTFLFQKILIGKLTGCGNFSEYKDWMKTLKRF